MGDDDRSEGPLGRARDVVTDVCYLIAIGIQVYIVIDQMTHGDLTMECKRIWGRAVERKRAERQTRKDASHLIFETLEYLDKTKEGTE
jgi:hypothetical protein